MRIFFAGFCFLVLFFSCETVFDLGPLSKEVVIPGGKHESDQPFKLFPGDTLQFKAKFTNSAQYECENPQNQTDINKLIGFSDCNMPHQKYSARIGWRWYNQELQIFSYVYDNGTRKFDYLSSVPLNTFITYKIIKLKDGYLFSAENSQKKIITSEYCPASSNYILWPYFGGNEKAPHDIVIHLQFT